MAAEVAIKKGNRYPPLESTLSEGTAINFEAPVNAVAVKLLIRKVGGSATSKAAEFVSKSAGTVRYKWTKADTEGTGVLNVEGEYEYEWEVEWESGIIENFPSAGHKTLEVKAILT